MTQTPNSVLSSCIERKALANLHAGFISRHSMRNREAIAPLLLGREGLNGVLELLGSGNRLEQEGQNKLVLVLHNQTVLGLKELRLPKK